MRGLRLVLVLLPLVLAEHDGWRIIGGEEATPAQFPYFAALQDEKIHMCGGAIIDANTVVTAAHCFKFNESPDTWSVVVGSPDRDSVPQDSRYQVASVYKHAKYDTKKTGFYDIAVVKTKQKIQFNDKVQPIQLSGKEERLSEGTVCRVMGYGYTDPYGSYGPADYVLTAPMQMQKNSFCAKSYKKQVTDEHLCAGGESYRGVCHGDSGGPLVCEHTGKPVIYGVTSYTRSPCGQWHSPAVFTRVGFYLDWIRTKMNRPSLADLLG